MARRTEPVLLRKHASRGNRRKGALSQMDEWRLEPIEAWRKGIGVGLGKAPALRPRSVLRVGPGDRPIKQTSRRVPEWPFVVAGGGLGVALGMKAVSLAGPRPGMLMALLPIAVIGLGLGAARLSGNRRYWMRAAASVALGAGVGIVPGVIAGYARKP